MARVDRLPEGAKEVLQTGSVIEREFSYELIKRVTELLERDLLARLSVLKDLELVYERGIYPDTTYIFKHALTQEVVYGSILNKRRKKLHNEIGKAIEEFYQENIGEHYGVLAEHFIKGENYEKGAEYLRLAGKKAQIAGSFKDAIAYAERRIACSERLPQTPNIQKKMIDARTVLGLYMTSLGYCGEAKEAVDPIIDLAEKQNYKKRLAQIYTILGAYNCWVEEDFSKALKYLKEALVISEEINDVVSLFFSNFFIGVILSYNCEFKKALNAMKKALDINAAGNSLWAISALKSFISYYIYYFQGKIEIGYQASVEAIRIAEESGDIYSKSIAFSTHGVSFYSKGLFKEAIENLLKGADFCERSNLFLLNPSIHSYLGETYFEIEEYQKSKNHYDKAIWLLDDKRSSPSLANLNKMGMAMAKVMDNEKDIELEKLYSYADDNKLKIHDGWMRRYICQILLNLDNQHIPEAEDWINKAIQADSANGMMFHLARDYDLYAELFTRKGDQSKARKNLNKAIEIYKECGADGWVKKAEEKMAGLF
jgi:tetratricopeptide (TPR) repeat protein